jgi:ABC-type molybdate transport system substrate-binding protein
VASSKDRIGIVYFTDYLLYQDRLKLLVEGPSEKARYPAAMTEQGMEKLAAGRFFTFLQSNKARLIFEKFGFRVDLSEVD